MLYLCFETFDFDFYSDPRHLIFEKNCRKPRNIKSLALTCYCNRTWLPLNFMIMTTVFTIHHIESDWIRGCIRAITCQYLCRDVYVIYNQAFTFKKNITNHLGEAESTVDRLLELNSTFLVCRQQGLGKLQPAMTTACLRQTFTYARVLPVATVTLSQARRRHVCGICQLGFLKGFLKHHLYGLIIIYNRAWLMTS